MADRQVISQLIAQVEGEWTPPVDQVVLQIIAQVEWEELVLETGSVDGTLPTLTGELSGITSNSGHVIGSLPKLSGHLAVAIDSIAATLPLLSGDIHGWSEAAVDIVGVLPKLSAQIFSYVTRSIPAPEESPYETGFRSARWGDVPGLNCRTINFNDFPQANSRTILWDSIKPAP